MLKFKKPEVKQQRVKILVYGEMGSGKSTLAASFPNVAYFDTEDTTSKVKYARAIAANGGGVVATGDLDEIIQQVKELMTNKHSFKTIVIDSLTVPYENYLLESENKVGSEFGRHIAEADKKVKHLVNLLLRIDMNVIVTCQSKREYGNGMNVLGNTYVGYKRLGYIFDLVCETSVLGNNFSAVVKKSRLEGFEAGEEIDFCYAEVAKRCSDSAIDDEVTTEELPSDEEIARLKHLIQVLKVPGETIVKWMSMKCTKSLEDKVKEK
jgi:adenosyl cobinamide kinase/adenosyl cobinamide phosphate guanylyltransferase